MVPRFRLPMFVVAAALLALMAVLATLQYKWLGRISDAERERMTANLAMHSTAAAQEFDRELTRAYATFQVDPSADASLPSRLSTQYDRWSTTTQHPRMIRNIFIVQQAEGQTTLQRFSPTTRFVEPAEWPKEFDALRAGLAKHAVQSPLRSALPETLIVRSMPMSVWPDIPALVIVAPMVFINTMTPAMRPQQAFQLAPSTSFVIVHLDRDYITQEMLPTILEQRFRAAGEAYQMAVVNTDRKDVIYTSDPAFTPAPDAKVDASADLFQVRMQEFGSMVAETRRITSHRAPSVKLHGETTTPDVPSNGRVSILLQESLNVKERAAVVTSAAGAVSRQTPASARWRLLVKHPSGSLEAAVNHARRRNLAVSFGVLALLGASVGFLMVSTRRAQELARQQMEFVAAVSHELRTPLAVIRSAADNLAEGVVYDNPQVRKYGDLVRGEGRRLTEMVEQILELAGIQSGQRGFALRPVPVLPILHDTVRASATLIEQAGLDVEFSVPDTLPPALGDEQALRRVFQNLIGNAIKYGAQGRWIGISARTSGREISITVADKGIGIPAAEQSKIFEPFYRSPGVISAQIQGAGLGLSLVHRIVEAHGGRITVRSTEGEGSEFTVRLPAASEQPVTENAGSPAAQPHHS
jgi:two-component system, OmpR family, sensor histidine kinase SenX3